MAAGALPDGFSVDQPSASSAGGGAGLPAGFTLDKAPDSPVTAAGLAESFGVGVPLGTIGMGESPAVNPVMAIPGLNSIYHGINDKVSNWIQGLHQPGNAAERAAQTVGEFTPGLIGGGEGELPLAARAVTRVLAPAAGSEAAGYLSQGTPYEPYARLAGAAVGGVGAEAAAARARNALLARPPVPPSSDAAVPSMMGTQLSEGQATGDMATIRREQAALRGQLGPGAEGMAQDFAQQQGTQVEAATDRVREGLDPLGQALAQTPHDAAGLVSDALTHAEGQRGALVAQDAHSLSSGIDQLPHPLDAADTVANSLRDVHQSGVTAAEQRGQQVAAQREALRSNLNPSGGVVANSPQEAADIISGAVGNQAERAQAATRAAYQELRDLPGDFHPAAFSGIGESIRADLNAGTEPIRVNPQTTPIANHALSDLDEILGEIGQHRDENGKLLPREPVTPAQLDDTRKRLNSFYGDAITASRASNNFSDVRAMRGIMNSFDDYVGQKLDRGAFRGDAANVAQTMQNARALNTSYRRTFTPRGPGDTVGSAIQNIVGRYEGQAAPPNQIAQWLYGGGALPTKIATRLLGIFGDQGPEAAALRQGYLSHIVERPEGVTQWGPNQVADRIYNALNGPGRALSETYFSPQQRGALRTYADSLRGTIEEAPAATDAVTRSINRIVGANGQPATSGEVSDLLFGRNAVGSSPTGAKLAQHIRDTQGPQSDAFMALRQGAMSKLTNAAAGPHGFDAQATADRIRDFLDTGRPLAQTLFTPEELSTLDRYATRLEQHAANTAAPKDEAERTLARIGGRDGQAPATPTEISGLLFGRSGGGDSGKSVRLIQRLKSEFGDSSPHYSAIKQGMFAKLIEPAEGRLDWGPQKISERLHEFLNGNGRPMAEAMYTPEERNLLQQYADLQKKLIVPRGGANLSETSTFDAPFLNRISSGISGLIGAVIGHSILPGLHGVGEIAGAALTSKASQRVSNARNARQIARQMPLITQSLKGYRSAAERAQIAATPPNLASLAVASNALSKSLKPLGIPFSPLNVLQGTSPANAQDDKRERGGRTDHQPDEGEPAQQNGFAAGGRVVAHNIDHAPTEAQKKAGNYAKDHVRIHGLDITIENAKGATRSGLDRDGKSWSVKMPAHYGYIKGTVGRDKDHVDVYVGPHKRSPHVFVVDQVDAESGRFDEHKVFLGFASRSQAKRAYLAAFSDGRGHARLGHMAEMPVDALKRWLDGGDTTKRIEVAGDDHKLSHKAVGYVAASRLADKHCSRCSMFRAGLSCTLVKEPILPGGWCRRFEAKS